MADSQLSWRTGHHVGITEGDFRYQDATNIPPDDIKETADIWISTAFRQARITVGSEVVNDGQAPQDGGPANG